MTNNEHDGEGHCSGAGTSNSCDNTEATPEPEGPPRRQTARIRLDNHETGATNASTGTDVDTGTAALSSSSAAAAAVPGNNPTSTRGTVWLHDTNKNNNDDNESSSSSLPSLPPMPSPLEYSNNNTTRSSNHSSPLQGIGMLLFDNSKDTSLFSNPNSTDAGADMDSSSSLSPSSSSSLQDRVHRALNQTIRTPMTPMTTPSPTTRHAHNNSKFSYAQYLEPTLEVAKLLHQIETLRDKNQELRAECTTWMTKGQSLQREKDVIMEARMTAELREREAKQECTGLQQEVEHVRHQIQSKDEEIDALQRRMDTVSTESQRALENERSAATLVKEKLQDEIVNLQTHNVKLEQENKTLANDLETTRAALLHLENNANTTPQRVETKPPPPSTDIGVQTETYLQIDTSSTSTPPTAKHSYNGRDEKTASALDQDANATVSPAPAGGGTTAASTRTQLDDIEALVSTTVHPTSGKSSSSNDKNHPHYSDESSLPIGERLCRIRDAAERASLIREHNRQVSRLKADHEADKKKLCQTFEREKEKLLQEAMSEMNAGYKGLRQRLESECQDKMERIKRQHCKEVEAVREEAKIAAASADESVEVAMAQVASANQRCLREVKRREALEIRLDRLQEEFNAQKKALAEKHAVNLSKLGHGWEAERKNLVDALQRECNSVFDRTKIASPRSVTTEFFADIEVAEKQHHHLHALSPLGDRSSNTEILSPTFSELDRTLRETEALVERVLSTNCNVDD